MTVLSFAKPSFLLRLANKSSNADELSSQASLLTPWAKNELYEIPPIPSRFVLCTTLIAVVIPKY
jgi:hypothetical protein